MSLILCQYSSSLSYTDEEYDSIVVKVFRYNILHSFGIDYNVFNSSSV